jgi:alkylation response protein AidB-like acyl-CoA dehydrogenase
MDFSFSAEQQMLLETARRYLANQYSFDQRKAILGSDAGWSPKVWIAFGNLGLLGLNVSEQDGGLGGGIVDSVVAGLAMGEHLVIEPYLASATIATRAIACLASDVQRAGWLPRLAAGSLVAVLVDDAQPDGVRDAGVAASRDGTAWVLNGHVKVVYHAPIADLLLVAARTMAARVTPDALFAIPAGTGGLALEPFITVDAQTAANVSLNGVRLDDSARVGGDVSAALDYLADYSTVALCGEALGALDRTLALTVDYTRNRSQFGGPISRFQALQHRMVDMLTRVEQTRSLVYLAASNLESADTGLRQRTVSAAKVLTGDAAQFVGQQAVQLHGGMGLADECSVSHYFKRLVAIRMRLGTDEAHLSRYAAQMSAA